MILNDSILIFILGFLTVGLALSLWLNFRLIYAFRRLPMPASVTPQKLEDGTVISDVPFDRIIDKKKVTLYEYDKYAKVMVFLTSKCNKCKSKLPELRASLDSANNLGVLIWIVTLESKSRMKSFLEDEALLDTAMSTNQGAYDYLNPEAASPYYLFVDAENVLQAQGFIGDENWINFMEQLKQEA